MKFSMKLFHLTIIIAISCIFSLIFISLSAAADSSEHISINCGGAAAATALGGREWLRDAAAKGSSTSSTAKRDDLITAVDPVPYKTARISLSQFSYSFHLNPGQKIIRLHFNPAAYAGFQNSNDLFTVEAGPYTFLSNFSASITARALGVATLAKEFCIIVKENQYLDVVFSPESNYKYKYNYAFVNGIEIISVPSAVSYCGGGEGGIHVLGQNYAIHLDNSTALEMVHRRNVKWGSDDGMFGVWASSLKAKAKKIWRVRVDVGFRYLVRLHLCELGLKIHKDFRLLIDDVIALASPEMLHKKGNLWYNYMVMVEGHKREGKRNISISLSSQHEFLVRHGPFEGFEVFKLSNHDRSLAAPNPPSPEPEADIPTLDYSGLGLITSLVFTLLGLATVIARPMFREENEPFGGEDQQCRCISLHELKKATGNFHKDFILGKGGFGDVYIGRMVNGRDSVAIKRLKLDSKQGESEFKAEIDILSKLRHANLVSLIGHCSEQQEMILVYEYMPGGTLADHLYKLARKNKVFCPLSWKQRLNICIGASRGLDYLHTGQGPGKGIIHRDVKSSNILLDDRFMPKVSDLGLAKAGSTSESQGQESTNLKGTDGYVDPNFFETHKLTQKSDTYSFGVVLLEVLSERAAVEPWNEEKRLLTKWAKKKIERRQVYHIVGPSLRGNISPDSLNTFVKIAERCLLDKPEERPAMTRVTIELETALEQQEKAESSSAYKQRDGFKDIDSSTENSHKEEKDNFLVGNEIVNVAADKCTRRRAKSMSGSVQTHTFFPRKQSNGIALINSGADGEIRTMVRWLSKKLWSVRKTRKPPYKEELDGLTLAAPYMTGNNIALPVNG